MRHQAYFYWWPRSYEVHSNAFLFTEGRWHAFSSACALNPNIVYSILRLQYNEKYLLKTSGGNIELKGDYQGWFSRSLRTSWVGLYQSFRPFYVPSRSTIFQSFEPKKSRKLTFTLWARSSRFTFSQSWTAINGACYWQFALEVRAQEKCEAWANCLRTDKVLQRRSVALFNRQ